MQYVMQQGTIRRGGGSDPWTTRQLTYPAVVLYMIVETNGAESELDVAVSWYNSVCGIQA